MLGIYRLFLVPVCYCPEATHSPAALCIFGSWPASQGLRLWCEEQAVLWQAVVALAWALLSRMPGGMSCLALYISTLPPPPLTLRGCHPQRFLTLRSVAEAACLGVGHKWLPQLLSLLCWLSWSVLQGRSSPPGGRQQPCQVSCQSEGPPWQGSGEPTQRVKQLPLGTLHRPSFDLSLAVWLVRRIILAGGNFLNWTYFHHGSRLAVTCLCCCKSNSYNFW